MSDLILQKDEKTMSSTQIAALLSVRPDNVKRTIKSLRDKCVISFTQTEEKSTGGRPATIFHINERDSYVVVAQLSPEFTATLVDEWQRLKGLQKPPAPALPQNYLEALEHLVIKEKQLIEQAPKVAFVDNCVARDNLMTATQVGQKHKLSAVKLNRLLDDLKVYSKSVKRGRAFLQWFIDKGYGEMKQTDSGFSQCLFTTLGEQWVNEKLISEGVV